MSVSGQEQDLTSGAEAPTLERSGERATEPAADKGPRGRMRRLMLQTAVRLMQSGVAPSVSDVAEAAEVSRATAYRHFPSQAAMIQAAVDEALGPILGWHSELTDPEARVADLFAFAFPRMEQFEATHRAALLVALEQWNRRQAGTLGDEVRVVRGNRRGLLRAAVEPVKAEVGKADAERLAQGLSLLFGIEAIIILKDIWGLSRDEAQRVASWAASALVRATIDGDGHDAGPAEPAPAKTAAKKPRRKGG